MYYFEVLKELYLGDIRYLIVGGLAVNLYGIPRVTQDIDLIISFENNNIKNLINVLEKLHYKPRLPVDPLDLANLKQRKKWIQEKNLKAFSFFNKDNNYKVVDILIELPFKFEDAYSTKVTKKIRSIEIYLVSMENLIIMKQKAGREQDLSDIKLLKKAINWKREGNG
ncbi:MAG: hypothetical protein EU549_05315 [Promethearchaeota archaeon]|nr:MAG: hypothetical protein EU549_05315 [Candidatus Lokiarchaeota archaeon]